MRSAPAGEEQDFAVWSGRDCRSPSSLLLASYTPPFLAPVADTRPSLLPPHVPARPWRPRRIRARPHPRQPRSSRRSSKGSSPATSPNQHPLHLTQHHTSRRVCSRRLISTGYTRNMRAARPSSILWSRSCSRTISCTKLRMRRSQSSASQRRRQTSTRCAVLAFFPSSLRARCAVVHRPARYSASRGR